MSGIVCAIRGGPASQPTIEKSIELAKEKNLPIHFLYVVNLDFMSHTTSSRVKWVYDEMDRMGEFILLVAQEKAEKEGVVADGTVRHGNVREEIIALSRDMDADYVVMGQPRSREEINVFTEKLLAEFQEQLKEVSRAEIIIAEGTTEQEE